MVILSHITEINIELTKIIPESLAKILGNVSDRTLSLSIKGAFVAKEKY